MKKIIFPNIIVITIIILLFGTLSTGCGKKISESDVSYAGPMLDNVLAGIKDKDYDKFSRDFSSTMKSASTKDSFDELVADLDSKIGEFQEKSFSGATTIKKDNVVYTVIIYKAKYSKETSDIRITISFSDNNGKKLIEGFFVNSSNP